MEDPQDEVDNVVGAVEALPSTEDSADEVLPSDSGIRPHVIEENNSQWSYYTLRTLVGMTGDHVPCFATIQIHCCGGILHPKRVCGRHCEGTGAIESTKPIVVPHPLHDRLFRG